MSRSFDPIDIISERKGSPLPEGCDPHFIVNEAFSLNREQVSQSIRQAFYNKFSTPTDPSLPISSSGVIITANGVIFINSK